MTELPEMTQGKEEPATARVILTLSAIGALAFVMLYSVLFPGHPFPGLGSVIPLFSELGDSVVWFFLLGIGLGMAMLVATLLGETIAD